MPIKYFIIVTALIITTFIIDYINRRNRKILYSFNDKFNSSLLLSIVFFSMTLILSSLWYRSFISTYRLLAQGGYINNVFELFNNRYLEDIQEYFFKRRQLIELSKIVYYRSGFIGLFHIYTFCCLTFIYFYNGYKKVVFSEKGVDYSKGNIPWRNILKYHWEPTLEAAPIYEAVVIEVKNPKFEKWLINKDNTIIRFKIKPSDRAVVDTILQYNILNNKTNT